MRLRLDYREIDHRQSITRPENIDPRSVWLQCSVQEESLMRLLRRDSLCE